MNLNIICLLLSLHAINGQLLLKRFRFPQYNLLNCMYKNISFNVKSKIECASYCNTESLKCSYCNTESLKCDGLFYNRDVSFCGLLDLAKFDWKKGKQQNETLVYLSSVSLEKVFLEMEMTLDMKRLFYGKTHLRRAAVKETDCLEECYFNEACQFFTFKDSICYFGMYNYSNGTVLESVDAKLLFLIKPILTNIYTKSPSQIPASNWTTKIYKFVRMTGSQALIKCQALCSLEPNSSCNLVVVQSQNCYLGNAFLATALTNIPSPTASDSYGNYDVWDEWTSWSICDGCNAQKTRTRSCNQPSSNFGGPSCSGDQLENLPCFDTACFSKGMDSDQPSFANYTTVASLLECQLLCKNYSLIACNYFVYNCLTLMCYLKSQEGLPLSNANASFGRPTC